MDDPERMEKHSSKLNKLNRDMRKLEAHKSKLQKQYDNQLQTMHTLYSDPELKEKVTKMTEKIAKMKAHHEQLTKEHKEDLRQQKKTLDEYARLNAKKRALVNKKIAIKNNVPSKEYFKKEYELQEEYEAMKKRHEDFQQLLINQVSSHPI
jgi:chromosome segregation ATPase